MTASMLSQPEQADEAHQRRRDEQERGAERCGNCGKNLRGFQCYGHMDGTTAYEYPRGTILMFSPDNRLRLAYCSIKCCHDDRR